jgi:hypothetical protein
MPTKPHAKTAAYLAEVEKPSVITRAKVVSAIETFDAVLGQIAIQATTHLAALNAATARESNPDIKAHFSEARQKVTAMLRLCAELDKRTTDLLAVHEQLTEHTERVTARIQEAAAGEAEGG